MSKVIWSTQQSFDNLVNSSVEDRLATLNDLGYDDSMTADLDDDAINDLIANGNDLYRNDLEDFEYNIAPEIAKQVRDGLVLDDNFNFVNPQDLINNVGNAKLIEDENGTLRFEIEGKKDFPIVGFSEDDDDFLHQLDRLGILESLHNLYPEKDDIEFDDVYYFGDMIPMEWGLLEEVMTRPVFGESMGEDMDEAVSTKNVKGLKKELEEIKDLAGEYGIKYFTEDMPFSNFDNDPTSIEYQYPEFYNVAYNFFKEMDFNKDKDSDDPMKNDEFKYLQQNDPAKLDDMMDELWYALDQSSWDTIIDMCDILIRKSGATTQAKDVYKKHYKSVLDDNQILADREKQASEFGESLKEEMSDSA